MVRTPVGAPKIGSQQRAVSQVLSYVRSAGVAQASKTRIRIVVSDDQGFHQEHERCVELLFCLRGREGVEGLGGGSEAFSIALIEWYDLDSPDSNRDF